LIGLAGQAAGTITFNPTDMFFQVFAVSAIVRDTTDPSLPREADVAAVTVDGCRLLGTNTAPWTAVNTQVFSAQIWNPDGRDGCACPVNWGCISNSSNGRQLTIQVGNPHPVGIFIDILMVVYGRGISMLPAGCDPGNPGTWRNPTPTPTPGFSSTPGGGSTNPSVGGRGRGIP
jgi:hypothetical protein